MARRRRKRKYNRGTKAQRRRAIALWRVRIKLAGRPVADLKEVWDRAVEFWRVRHWTPSQKEEWDAENITIPRFNVYIRTMLANLLYSNPRHYVKAKMGDTRYAQAVQKFLDYASRECGDKKHHRRVILEALLKSMGVAELYWDESRQLPMVRKVKLEDIRIDPAAVDDITTADWIAKRDILSKQDLRDLGVPPSKIASLRPSRLETVDDELLSTLQEHDIKEEFDWFVRWTVWSKIGISPWDGIRGNEAAGTEDDYREGPGDRRVVFSFLENNDEWWLDPPTEWPYTLDDDEYPFEFLQFPDNEIPGQFYGFSDFDVLRSPQEWENWMASFYFNGARRSASRKILYDPTFINQSMLALLRSHRDMEFIPCEDLASASESKLVQQLGESRVPQDVIKAFITADETFDKLAIAPQTSGAEPSREKSATQARIEDDRAQQHFSQRLTVVDDYLRNIARKRLQIAREYVPAWSRYVGVYPYPDENEPGRYEWRQTEFDLSIPQDREAFLFAREHARSELRIIQKGIDFFLGWDMAGAWKDNLSPEEIKAEVDVEIEPGSTRKLTQEAKQEKLTFAYDRVLPFMVENGAIEQATALANRLIASLELPNDEELMIDPQVVRANAEQQQQAAMAGQGPPPGMPLEGGGGEAGGDIVPGPGRPVSGPEIANDMLAVPTTGPAVSPMEPTV